MPKKRSEGMRRKGSVSSLFVPQGDEKVIPRKRSVSSMYVPFGDEDEVVSDSDNEDSNNEDNDALKELVEVDIDPSIHKDENEDEDTLRKKEVDQVIRKTFSANRQALATAVNTTAKTLPEVNYYAFSLFETVLSEMCHVIAQPAAGVGMGWNFADGTCQIVEGTFQLSDDTTHRPMTTKAKGTMNILSGLQLSILTGISFSTFGAPAFAAAFGVGFTLSLDDTCCAIRRFLDTDYLIKDNLERFKKNIKLIETLEEEIRQVREQLMDQSSLLIEDDKEIQSPIEEEVQPIEKLSAPSLWLLKKVLASKEKRLEALKKQQKIIQDETVFTFAAEKHKNRDYKNLDISEFLKAENNQDLLYNQDRRSFNNTLKNIEYANDVYHLRRIKYAPKSKLYRDRDKVKGEEISLSSENCTNKIKKVRNPGLLTDISQAVDNNILWGLAFSGMLLACIPGCQPIGAALVVVASTLFLYKHATKLADFLFFSDKEPSKTKPSSRPPSPHKRYPMAHEEEGLRPKYE